MAMAKKKGGKGKRGKDAAVQNRIATNRRARHNYEIMETLEAGLALAGPEVKSLRSHGATLKDAYVAFRRGEAYLHNMHIAPYAFATRENPDPERERKLLLSRAEISRWEGRVAERGFTIVPLDLHWRRGRAKAEIALVRGKRQYDKRRALRERDDKREQERAQRRARRAPPA